MGHHSYSLFLGSIEWIEISSNGCEDYFIECIFERECLHVSIEIFLNCEGMKIKSMYTHRILIFLETNIVCLI